MPFFCFLSSQQLVWGSTSELVLGHLDLKSFVSDLVRCCKPEVVKLGLLSQAILPHVICGSCLVTLQLIHSWAAKHDLRMWCAKATASAHALSAWKAMTCGSWTGDTLHMWLRQSVNWVTPFCTSSAEFFLGNSCHIPAIPLSGFGCLLHLSKMA